MIRPVLIWLALVGPATAGEFCDAVRTLSDTKTLTLPTRDAPVSRCTDGLASGGVSFTHCSWGYDFRDPAARAAFDQVLGELSACPETTRRDFEDQQVNHPDSYDLVMFDAPGAEIALSLKDKGGPQKTYIFLRTQSR